MTMTPEEIFRKRPNLATLTNQELMSCFGNIDTTEINGLVPIIAEILRRMNEKNPLLTKE